MPASNKKSTRNTWNQHENLTLYNWVIQNCPECMSDKEKVNRAQAACLPISRRRQIKTQFVAEAALTRMQAAFDRHTANGTAPLITMPAPAAPKAPVASLAAPTIATACDAKLFVRMLPGLKPGLYLVEVK